MPVNWGIRPEKGFIGISDLLRIKNDQFGIMNRTALKKRIIGSVSNLRNVKVMLSFGEN